MEQQSWWNLFWVSTVRIHVCTRQWTDHGKHTHFYTTQKFSVSLAKIRWPVCQFATWELLEAFAAVCWYRCSTYRVCRHRRSLGLCQSKSSKFFSRQRDLLGTWGLSLCFCSLEYLLRAERKDLRLFQFSQFQALQQRLQARACWAMSFQHSKLSSKRFQLFRLFSQFVLPVEQVCWIQVSPSLLNTIVTEKQHILSDSWESTENSVFKSSALFWPMHNRWATDTEKDFAVFRRMLACWTVHFVEYGRPRSHRCECFFLCFPLIRVIENKWDAISCRLETMCVVSPASTLASFPLSHLTWNWSWIYLISYNSMVQIHQNL